MIRVLPEDDKEIVLAWMLHNHNYAATARMYGVTEGAVRKRVKRYVQATPEGDGPDRTESGQGEG